MIAYVERYGTCTNDYVYYVRHDSGDIDQYVTENIPKFVFRWMARSEMKFIKNNKTGEYFYRFV